MGGGSGVNDFFYYEPKFKIKKHFFERGGGGGGEGGGARVSDFFFTKNPNFKKNGQTNRPNPICPFNFFEVGGMTMH